MKLLFTLLFLVLAQIASSHIYIDSVSQKNSTAYTINDPHNPNCPCHADQKKAEAEYSKYIIKQGKEKKSEAITAVPYRTTVSGSATKTKNKISAKKHSFKRHQKLKRFLNHPRKFKPDYRFCVRW